MEDEETPQMCKYGERKTTQIMMATVRNMTSSSGLRIFQVYGFVSDWVYNKIYNIQKKKIYIYTHNLGYV